MKTAIVTGVTGQDGAYLTEFLIGKGYRVIGTYRRSSSVNFWRLKDLEVLDHPHLILAEYDLSDLSNTFRLIEKFEPDEIYNLAAQSFVSVSFEQPIMTGAITGLGAVHLLEAIRIINPRIRFYQASTSEMFGKVQHIPQTENTPFYPRSPYGIAKLYAHWMTINYREAYDIFGTSGILFNHESPLRGKEFVTRKIADTVAKIAQGKETTLRLGNIDAKRDWGFAKEYVEGMWAMLQTDNPETYILSTNQTHTVRSFVELAFKAVDINIIWKGKDENEIGYNSKTNDKLIIVDKAFFRPAEVDILIGDATKAKEDLNWEAKMDLPTLCRIMVEADMQRNTLGNSF